MNKTEEQLHLIKGSKNNTRVTRDEKLKHVLSASVCIVGIYFILRTLSKHGFER
jgi:hypothetical protein